MNSSSSSSSASSSASAAGADYSGLLITPSDIRGEPFTAAAPTVSPGGKDGIVGLIAEPPTRRPYVLVEDWSRQQVALSGSIKQLPAVVGDPGLH